MGWRPKPRPGADASALRLSPLEAHVLQRLDGQQDLEGLPAVTGLTPARLEELLTRLVQAGAVQAPEAEVAGGAPAPAAAAPRAPVWPGEPVGPEPDAPAELEASSDASADALADLAPTPVPGPDPDAAPEEAPAEREPEASTDEVPAHVPGAGREGPSDPMALYARELAPLALEERVQRAPLAGPAELSAFCFDPAARVILAALTNPSFGLVQARLVARHHRDASGLEKLLATAAFAADAVVRQELLKNPQLQVPVLRRLWGGKRALELWKASTTREATEQARMAMKDLFRTRFSAAEAEERVEAILRTDGRCLALLATVPVDGRTLAQLCARSYTSSLLVQNLARWGAAPTPLLAHLLRQPLVRQQRSLRQLVLQHPNAPSAVD